MDITDGSLALELSSRIFCPIEIYCANWTEDTHYSDGTIELNLTINFKAFII